MVPSARSPTPDRELLKSVTRKSNKILLLRLRVERGCYYVVASFLRVVEFQFTDEQRTLAIAEGTRRQKFNEERNIRGRNRAPRKGLKAHQMHLLGAAAEVAVASYLGAEQYLFLNESPVRDSCDLPGVDVKCRSRHDYDLLVQLDDDLNKTYVLVTIQDEKTYIHGWIPGVQVPLAGKIREFIPKRPCYAIPQSCLLPIDTLKTIYNPKNYLKE